jgi:simple sugar transport system ATP-binding protein
LCLAGVEGNGQHEVVEAVTGLNRRWTGELRLNGADIRKKTIRRIRRMGLSHIPEDRLRHGVDAAGSILDNMISLDYDRSSRVLGLMKLGKLQKRTQAWMQAYQIKATGPGQRLAMLSGGNMQKVLAAREIEQNPDVLVADQPTRGVDVGAIELIHQRIVQLRDTGAAVMLVSADMAEVFALADRILVFHEGEITAEITDPASCTAEQLGRYMLGLDRMERKDRA